MYMLLRPKLSCRHCISICLRLIVLLLAVSNIIILKVSLYNSKNQLLNQSISLVRIRYQKN